ncbi:crustapain [Diabrotica virgifera virgifera]|uniref:Crustapain-like n=1 Tax=Diabrotica virgifera virgifera TaxID=50390 RepID=A0A6P7G2B3_DIAVI|nr:crustapain [Diabrotica virgifera virgifera]
MFFKYFLFLFAVVVIAQALTDEEEFDNYKKKFNKSYDTPEEEQKRFKIFQDNLRFIEDHNQKYQRGEVSSTVGVNQFADQSKDEWANRNHGLKID